MIQVIRVCLKNVWLYFYISALWNPILYKSQRRGVPAAFGWCFCSSNDRKGAGTSRVTRPLLYSNRSQFSCIPFRVYCQAWGTRSVPLQRLPGIHSILQYNANSGGWGGGVLPAIPHWILTRKICFPCSVHSHPPGIHHTEVSNESTCLIKNSSIHAHQLADWLQDYFTIFPYSFKAIVPSTCKDII